MANPILSLAARAANLLPDAAKRGLYRLGPLTRLIRGALNQAAPQGIVKVEIASGLLAGLEFNLDMQSEKDYWLGTYEAELQAALGDLIRPGMVCYDVGANVGYISLALGKLAGPQGRVLCFEALPANATRLRSNLSLNSAVCQFEVIARAVADRSGETDFFVHSSDDMGKLAGSAGRSSEYAGKISVETVSLDDYVYREGGLLPDAVKMDIEGGEVLAFPGMRRILAEGRPLVLLELHGPESAQAAWKALTGAGYTIHRMQPGTPQVSSLDALDWKAYLIGRPPLG